jgi:hypothetical protein
VEGFGIPSMENETVTVLVSSLGMEWILDTIIANSKTEL